MGKPKDVPPGRDAAKDGEFLAHARAMVAAGERRLVAIDRERAVIMEDLAGWRAIVSAVARVAGERGCADAVSEDGSHDFSAMTHGQSAAVALGRIGHPATAAVIRDELGRMGHHVNDNAKYAANILYISMSRLDGIFRRLADGRWELAADKEPPHDQDRQQGPCRPAQPVRVSG